MPRSLVFVVTLAAAGCAPKLLISEVDPAQSGLRLPDWSEPWNGEILVVGTAVVQGMSVTSRPSRTLAIVRVRYRWEQTPLGKDYLYGLGCGRPPTTIASAEQEICDRAVGSYLRDVEYRWDNERRAWLAGRVDDSPEAERRSR